MSNDDASRAAPGGEYIHVIPEQDLREHACRTDCWCRPTPDVDEPRVIVHHSMDGREQFETGERRTS